MTKKIQYQRSPEQLKTHAEYRKERRKNNEAYKQRVQDQSRVSYWKKRIKVMTIELRKNGYEINENNPHEILRKWKLFTNDESAQRKEDRYNRLLEYLRKKYKDRPEYRDYKIKKAEEQYKKRLEFVKNLIGENKRLKKKLQEIQNG